MIYLKPEIQNPFFVCTSFDCVMLKAGLHAVVLLALSGAPLRELWHAASFISCKFVNSWLC